MTSGALRNLDERRAAVLESLCETIVPGSGRVGPVVYIDAIMSEMPEPVRAGVIGSRSMGSPRRPRVVPRRSDRTRPRRRSS